MIETTMLIRGIFYIERGRQLSLLADSMSRRMSRSFAAGSESGESACERASRHPGWRAGSCRRKARCQTLCSPANVGVPWWHDRQWGELGARPKHKLHRPMPAVAAESALCASRNVRTQSRALRVAGQKLNHWRVSASCATGPETARLRDKGDRLATKSCPCARTPASSPRPLCGVPRTPRSEGGGTQAVSGSSPACTIQSGSPELISVAKALLHRQGMAATVLCDRSVCTTGRFDPSQRAQRVFWCSFRHHHRDGRPRYAPDRCNDPGAQTDRSFSAAIDASAALHSACLSAAGRRPVPVLCALPLLSQVLGQQHNVPVPVAEAMDVLRACHHEQYRSLLACGALSRRVWACARGGFSRRAGLVLCWQMHPRCFSEVGQSSTCTFHSALATHSVSSVKSRCL
jgi:hypothetical protein